MAYIGTQPKDIRSFGKAKFDFTATQGQTAFTGADDDGKALGFTAGQVSVYVNGILMDDSDYTASNGNTITLTSAANASDIISVVALQTDIPNSDYVPATGGTFSGHIDTSSITADGNIFASTGDGGGFVLEGGSGIYRQGITSMALNTNGSERVRIDGSGNLLVGKTSADGGVNGFEARSAGETYITATSATPLAVKRNTSDGELVSFSKDGTSVGSIKADAGSVGIGSGNTGLLFYDGGDRIIPRNGTSTSDGSLDLGYSTDRFKDLYLSGGVYLGGTGAANKLDDYEEGTFTPYWNAGTSLVYDAQIGIYTKIGNLVTYHIHLSITSGTITASAINGLPFTVANVSALYPMTGGVWNDASVSYPSGRTSIGAYANRNTTTATVECWGSGVVPAYPTYTSLAKIYMTGQYYTA